MIRISGSYSQHTPLFYILLRMKLCRTDGKMEVLRLYYSGNFERKRSDQLLDINKGVWPTKPYM